MSKTYHDPRRELFDDDDGPYKKVRKVISKPKRKDRKKKIKPHEIEEYFNE